MNYVDDWGNVIYTRNTYGDERFASFSNTNHQNEFYAPARLDRTSSGILYSNSFDQGVNDLTQANEAGDSSATADFTNFGRYAPSLKLSMSQSASDIRLTKGIQSSNVLDAEFRVYLGDTSTNSFQFSFTSGGTAKWGVLFKGGITYLITPSGSTQCNGLTYASGTWYTISLSAFPPSGGNTLYTVWENGGNQYNFCQTTISTLTLDGLGIEASNSGTNGAYALWIDDLHVTKDYQIYINGLMQGQIAVLIAADGTPIGTAEELSGQLVLLDGSIPFTGKRATDGLTLGDESIQIYGTDGTLEYVSPRTDFYGGDTYTFVPSRTLDGRLLKTRTGFDYYSNMMISEPADLSTEASSTCWDSGGFYCGTWDYVPADGWSSNYFLPTPASGTQYSHNLGPFPDLQDEWVSGLTGAAQTPPTAQGNFLVTYAYVPTAPSRMPVTIGLGARTTYNNTWYAATWGAIDLVPATASQGNPNAGCKTATGQTCPLFHAYMGGFSPTQSSVQKFIIKESDLFTGPRYGYPFPTGNLNGYYYDMGNGGVWFDGTSIGASDTGSITVTGIPVATDNRVSVYWATNDTLIGQGYSTTSTVIVSVYPMLSAFPVQVKIKVDQCTSASSCSNNIWNILYYSAPITIWGGDQFNYLGQSEFYDQSSTSLLPCPAIHDSNVGTSTPQGDCRDAVLCYDMETIQTSSDIQSVDGTAWDTTNDVVDLSGNGNAGTLQQSVTGLQLSSPSGAASGLGLSFDGASNYISVPSPTQSLSGSLTISMWIDPKNVASARLNPIDKNYGGEFAATIETSGSLSIYWGQSQSNYVGFTALPSGTIVNNKLRHVVIVRNAANNTLIAYYNGAASGNWQTYTLAPSATTSPVLLAHGYTGSYFQGTTDQVVIYAKALTPSQVLGLYQSRLPNTVGSYAHLTSAGLPDLVHTLYNGAYVEKAFGFDVNGWGQPVSSTFNGNTTTYDYSSFYGGAFVTSVTTPDNIRSFKSYDVFTGNLLGTVARDCGSHGPAPRTRFVYDAADRLIQTAYYDADSSTVLYLDMETVYAVDAQQDWAFADVSCNSAYNAIKTSGSLGPYRATYGPTGLSGLAQTFDGSSYITVSSPMTNFPSTSTTLAAWVKGTGV